MPFKMHKKLHISPPSPAVTAVIAALVILVLTLYVPPLIGMADNGDFYRIINGNGLYKLDRGEPDQFLDYFSSRFGVYQYFNEYESSLLSSQTPFIHAAIALDRLFTGNDALFDVRFLALLTGLWALVSVYLIVDYATFKMEKRFGYVVSAIAVLMFFDTGYIAYYNSFYAEGLVQVSFLSAMACALLIRQQRYSPNALLAGYLFSGFVLTCSKQQNAPLGVLLGLLCVPLVLGSAEGSGKAVFWPENTTKRRVAAGVSASFLCFIAVAVYILIPQEFVEINQYHAMTRGVMMSSRNPEKVLERFEIDPQYTLLDGSIYYERYPAVDVESRALKTEFFPKYNFVSVSTYYLTHPRDLFFMLDCAFRNAYSIRPEVIGNFERSAGREPAQKASFFTFHSALKNVAMPKTAGFAVIWIILIMLLSFKDRWRMIVLVFVILSGLAQIGVSIVGAGDADLSKHIFLYNVAFDFSNYLILSTVAIPWWARAYRKKHPKAKKEEAVCA